MNESNGILTDTVRVHIHAPQPTDKRIASGICRDCGWRRSWFIGIFTPWYGWSVTCLRCGRNHQDGERMPLPFMRGARQKSIENAKRRFREMAVTQETPT